jgi:hypothetical protein
MNHSKICILIFFCSLLAACKGRYTTNDTILRAEALLNSKPDSAQQLLLSIPHPEKLAKADYAAWCLQYTHSQYKLYQDIKSDSLICISVDYYKNTHLPKQSGTVYYLWGCILQLQQKNKEAMWAYKKAEDLLKETSENRLKGLVDFKIGNTFMQNELFNQSLKYFRKSQQYFNLSKNQNYQAFVYRSISEIYIRLNYPFDSIIYYSNKALKLSKQADDTENYYSVLAQQGEILYNKDYNRSKECLLKGYRFFPAKKSYYAAYLSYIYSKLNKPDSAKYYLNIALADTTNLTERSLKFLAAAYVNKNQGNQQQAFHFLEKAYISRDSVFQQSIRSQAYRIDKQYDLTQKEKENASLKISNQRKVIFISLLIIGVLILLFVISYIINSHKKKILLIDLENKIKQQEIEYELSKKQIENEQKQQLLLIKIQNRINNSILFNKLNMGLTQSDKQEEFTKLIVEQSTLSENDWQLYIDEVDQIFDKKITGLLMKSPDLSKLDLIVITLICLQVNILDSCILLNMHKSTLYKRRNRIKDRIGLSGETDLEEWIQQIVGHKFAKEDL